MLNFTKHSFNLVTADDLSFGVHDDVETLLALWYQETDDPEHTAALSLGLNQFVPFIFI